MNLCVSLFASWLPFEPVLTYTLAGGPVYAEKSGAYGIAGTYERYKNTLIYEANWGTALHDQVKARL